MENRTGTVATYRASDPERGTVSWLSLSGTDSSAFELSNSGALTFKTAPDHESQDTYEVTVRAFDGGLTGTLDVTVSVTDVDEAPEILGLDSIPRLENFTGTLATYAARDPEGLTNTFTWSLSGTDAGDFEISSSGALTFKSVPDHDAPADSNRDNEYVVTVRANDGSLTGTLDVTVTITNIDEPPTITGQSSVEFVENRTGTVATYQASDPERATVSWLSLSGTDSSAFELSAGGVLTFRAPPDHESQETYAVTLRASDGGLTGTLDVTISVTNVDEPPDVTGTAHVIVEENSTDYVGRYGATDPERAPTSWATLSGPDRSHFELTDAGDLSFTAVPDFDARADANRDNQYEVTVRASDGGLTGVLDVTVTVTNVNEPPAITGPASVTYPENATMTVASYSATDPEGGTVIWEVLAGTDRDDFTFSNGVLTFVATPNFESPTDIGSNNEYSVTVRASDGSNMETHDVTVTVTNEDEPGTLDLSSEQPQEGTALTATLADSDRVLSESWSWERSQNRSTWTEIIGETAATYTPVAADLNHYLRVTVEYTDGHGSGKREEAIPDHAVQAPPPMNDPPEFPDTSTTRSIAENSGKESRVGTPVTANDPNNDRLAYTLSGPDADSFTVDRTTGQIRVGEGTVLNFESGVSYSVTLTAADPSSATDSIFVEITVTDVNEAPEAVDDSGATDEDTAVNIRVLTNDTDPENDDLTVSLRNRPRNGSASIEVDNTVTYTPSPNYHGADTFTYSVSDAGFSDEGAVSVTIRSVNDAPEFSSATAERSVSESAQPGANVGAPIAATDVDGDTLTYRLTGAAASDFEIEEHTGQITVSEGAVLATQTTYAATITADDQKGGAASIDVTITVTTGPIGPPIITGGGGGGPSGPSPSLLDFEWNVKRDIEELDSGHDTPSGLWSDGVTLWLLQNGDGADDAIYAYDLESGERVEDREFDLDERNRAPRGVWSDGTTVWVSDSGQNHLFAHDLATGERLADRDIALAERNRAARGIWSSDGTMWVLDGGKDSIFAYDLERSELLAEYALHEDNDDPHGLWSDGVSMWVSNHDPKRLFAYGVPARPDAPRGRGRRGGRWRGPRTRARPRRGVHGAEQGQQQQPSRHLVRRRCHVRGGRERRPRLHLQHA